MLSIFSDPIRILMMTFSTNQTLNKQIICRQSVKDVDVSTIVIGAILLMSMVMDYCFVVLPSCLRMII